ncbi:Rz-like lysis system protein LysB [Trinickia symbiotica]|uniref:Rz-like lysis system protein LysB n=1 Tax=Trinickia symbiotica TaxID=863227 RepID=UPI000D1772CA|nr:Rz-like lysis system protein LysB [Trinickia symbiotica]
MSGLAAKLVAALLALAALVGGASYVRAMRAELADVSLQLADARKGIIERDSTIEQARRVAAKKAEQQAQLNRAQGAIASKLAVVQFENRRLTDENAELRAWTNTRLPDDVVRLQTSPALTGANDYVERVPGGEPMHAASDGTANER